VSASPAPAQTTGPPWNHDPDSPVGPLHWGSIGYSSCGDGTAQSPVNITNHALTPFTGPPVRLNYEESELELENTGHVIEVVIPIGATSTLTAPSGAIYPLVHYHFHIPAERQVNGRLADLEAHFVHTNSSGESTVLGVFYDIGRSPNRLLDRLLLSAPAVAGQTLTLGRANPGDLLPDDDLTAVP
jgi:carbonic anhydrase